MESISDYKSTLVEVTADFLLALPPQDRAKTQTEVYKFIRWFGLHRKVNELSPVDVASYGEQITPSAAKLLKRFLAYVCKKGFIRANLSPHLRAKRASSHITASRRSSQVQATLSAQGYAELKLELANLKSQRSSVVEDMRRAAADKDFRENAPLQAAREQKSHLEGRIEELETTLKLAKIVDGNQGTLRIKLGDIIVLSDLSSRTELSYALVDPREANPTKGKISVASPLGKVLLDKEKGQTVEVAAPAGIFSYRIEDIHQG
ncbi:MAG: GreA/GreB family elongation factor [Dehalococcoidia bacterium]|nr:GreA/GreB family elongation factor [Dehalococcoidia bacterium]